MGIRVDPMSFVKNKKVFKCFMNGRSCVYESIINSRIAQITRNEKPQKAFVLMSFSEPLDSIYNLQIAPYITHNSRFPCIPERSDSTRRLGYVICEQVCKKIQEANWIIAELSFKNPNVFYELGISVALKKAILPMCIDTKHNHIKEEFEKINIKTPLLYPIFGVITGDFKDFMFNLQPFDDIKQMEGLRLVVLHDGRKIQSKIKGNELNFNFSDMCKNAAGNALARIFDASNLGKYPGLNEYKKSDFDIIDINVNQHNLNQVIAALKESYCVLIDTQAESPILYFWLGFIHGLGGFAVPINTISDTDCESAIPFDTRSLWHVYVEQNNPTELTKKLYEILEFVFIERSKRKNRDEFWKKILSDNEVSIFLGSKFIDQLGRNTIGDWDYRTAAELTSFLSRTKETIQVTLESPITKKNLDKIPNDYKNWLKDQLKGKNCIIVASADVNDLTEIALSGIYKLKAFESTQNYQNFTGFIPYKRYNQSVEDIKPSTFFHFTVDEKQDAIRGFEFRVGANMIQELTEKHQFPNKNENQQINTLLGQLIISKNPEDENKYVILIIGISGPATLGIAQMLTGALYQEFTVNSINDSAISELIYNKSIKNVKETKKTKVSKDTKETTDNKEFTLPISYDVNSEREIQKINEILRTSNTAQAIISVDVYYPKQEPQRSDDQRKIVNWVFTDLKTIFNISNPSPIR